MQVAVDWGPVSGWFSGAISALVLSWALIAWTIERRRAKRLANDAAEDSDRDRAHHVGAWIEPLTRRLREISMDGELREVADGSPCLVLVNTTELPVYEWAAVVGGPQGTPASVGSRDEGLIPPSGVFRAIPLRNMSGPVRRLRVESFRYSVGDAGWHRDSAGIVSRRGHEEAEPS